MGWTDSEQFSNRLQLDIISLLFHISCEFGQIMTRYDFLGARRVILSNVLTDFKLTYIVISLLVNFSCDSGQIFTRYDFLWTRKVSIMLSFRTVTRKRIDVFSRNFCRYVHLSIKSGTSPFITFGDFKPHFDSFQTCWDFSRIPQDFLP